MTTIDQKMFHGNLGASTDTLFLCNGDVPGTIGLSSKDSDTDLRLSDAEGAGGFPLIRRRRYSRRGWGSF